MPVKIKVLVVDDEEDTLKVIASNLSLDGYFVDTFTSPVYALKRFQEKDYDTVLVDYQMPEMDGFEFLQKARAINRDVPVILFTAHATISRAVEAMKEGAVDYLVKPLNYDELKIVLRNSITVHLLRKSSERLLQDIQKKHGFQNLLGISKVMKKIFTQIEIASKTNGAVLLLGEKGTGKETIAKAIHYSSLERKLFPFVSMDCSCVTQPFVDAELFGCENRQKEENPGIQEGRLSRAEGGTLFLTEIHALPLLSQLKLLQFLEDKTFSRVNGSETLTADVRIIAATGMELLKAVSEKTFHEELYYKLNVLSIVVPPLRERREEIPSLVGYFLKMYASKHSREACCLSPAAYAKLLLYNFPGNIAELESLIERACIVSQSSCIDLEDLPQIFQEKRETDSEGDFLSPFSKEKKKVVENFERDYLLSLLTATRGKIGEASKISGIAERNLHEKLKKYGLHKEDFKVQE